MFDLVPFGRRDRNMFNYLDNLEKNFFNGMGGALSEIKTDIIDKGDKYLLQAELPGFKKDDISIEIDGDYLTIKAEKKYEKKDESENKYIRQERSYCSTARSFNISDIKADKITAEYKDGVLEMTLPKCEDKPPKAHRIEIK